MILPLSLRRVTLERSHEIVIDADLVIPRGRLASIMCLPKLLLSFSRAMEPVVQALAALQATGCLLAPADPYQEQFAADLAMALDIGPASDRSNWEISDPTSFYLPLRQRW